MNTIPQHLLENAKEKYMTRATNCLLEDEKWIDKYFVFLSCDHEMYFDEEARYSPIGNMWVNYDFGCMLRRFKCVQNIFFIHLLRGSLLPGDVSTDPRISVMSSPTISVP